MKDKRISEQEFGLSLNLDDTIKALGLGDSRYILNVLSGRTKSGDVGAIQNEKGNTLVELSDMLSGTNKVIGEADDKQNNAILYFLYNSNGNHGIYRYNIDSNTIDKVLHKQSVLNFQVSGRDGYINHANVVDGLLSWVDGNNEARRLNIEMAIEYTAGTGGYPAINEQTITAIKAPPMLAPTAKRVTDISRSTNYLREKGFQFAYRYVYWDNEKSVFSTFSRTNYPDFDPSLADEVREYWRINQYNDATTSGNFPLGAEYRAYNAIDLSIKLGDINVQKIEIAVKESELDAWNLIETIDQDELVNGGGYNAGDNYKYRFYNDKKGITISDEEMLKSQDYLPQAPKTQEYTHLNNLVYGNFVEGYDLEDIDASVSHEYSVFNRLQAYFTNRGSIDNSNIKASPQMPVVISGTTARVRLDLIYSSSLIEEGELFLFQKLFLQATDRIYFPDFIYRVTDSDVLSVNNLQDNLVEALINAGYQSVQEYNPGSQKWVQFSTNGNNFEVVQRAKPTDWNLPTLKQGAYHQWAIIYKDKFGRRGAPQSSESLTLYVPMLGELNAPSLSTQDRVINSARITINHTPPEWAYSYDLLYTGALNIEDFIQYPYQEAKNDANEVIPSRMSTDLWTDYVTDENSRVIRSFSFEPEQRMREIYGVTGTPSKSVKSVTVSKVDSTSLQQTLSSNTLFLDASAAAAIFGAGPYTSTVEQYIENQEELEATFYECGLSFPILNPGTPSRKHGGDVNQTNSSGAEIEFNVGDVWIRYRPYTSPILRDNNKLQLGVDERPLYCPIIEDPWYSDYFKSSDNGLGRVYGENNDFKRTVDINGLVHTNSYLEGTKTNGLNSVDFGSYTYVNLKDGAITAIAEVGFTLKVIQQRRLTSIYMGRQVTTNPQGTQDIILSDRVFSSTNPSELDYGTNFPESVVVKDRHVYFFDDNYGKVIRDSANGPIPISDIKMATKFLEVSERIKTTDLTSYCNGGWNNELDAYVFSYYEEGLGSPEIPAYEPFTVSFQEDINRWKSFHSYVPERMAHLGRVFVTFLDGKLWLHNSNEKRCNFYGVQYEMVAEPVFNIEPDKVKVFQAIALQSNKAPLRVEVKTLPNDNYPSGMSTRMLGANFKLTEGNYYASIKKDLNTPSLVGQSDTYRLNNGRPIRGNAALVRCIFDDTSQVVLTRAIMQFNVSERSD